MSGGAARLAARIAQLTGNQAKKAAAAKTRAGGKTTPPNPPVSEYAKWRAGIISVLFFGVIVTGTLYGASLKTETQIAEKKRKAEEATAEETIAILENRRANLNRLKLELEEKVAELQIRRGEGTMTAEQLAQQKKDKLQARPLDFFRGRQ